MNKKLLAALLSLCCLCAAAFGIAGCSSEHEHTYSDGWNNNETQHWHAATCEHTDEKSGVADHTYGDGTVTTAATCTTAGVKTYTCTVCSYVKTEAIPATGHSYGEWVAEVSATCTENGTKAHYECSVCHKYFDADKNEITDLTIPAAGHDYDYDNIEWSWSDSTTEAVATATVTCKNDSSHTYHPTVQYEQSSADATCTTAGTVTYKAYVSDEEGVKHEFGTPKTISGAVLGHDYDYDNATVDWDGWQDSESEKPTITVTCKREGCTEETGKHTTTIAAENITVTCKTTEATCTTAGKKIYTAKFTVNGTTYTCLNTHTEEIPALGHSWSAWTVTDENKPTETETGKATRTCAHDDCDAETTDKEYTLPVLSSENYNITNDTATCTKAGTATYTYNKDGVEVSFTVTTQATGHTKLTKHEAKAATESEDGNIEYWTCDACGLYFSDAEATVETTAEEVVVEALGTKVSSFDDSVAKTYKGLSDPDEYGQKYSYMLTLNANGTATYGSGTYDVYQYNDNYASDYKYKFNVSVNSGDGYNADFVIKFNINDDGTITLYDPNYNLKAVLSALTVQSLKLGEIGSLTVTTDPGASFDTYKVSSSAGGDYIFAITHLGVANGQAIGLIVISVEDENGTVKTFSAKDPSSSLIYTGSTTFYAQYTIELSEGVNYVTVGMASGGYMSSAKTVDAVFLSANIEKKTMTVVPDVPYDLATELSLSDATYRPTEEGYVDITDAGGLTADEAYFGKSLTVYAAGSDVTYILSLTINYNEYTVTVKDGASAKIDPEGEDNTLQLLVDNEEGTTVVWSIDNSEKIDATISDGGLLTAGSKTGVATVRATVKNSAEYVLGYATIQINISSVTDASVFTWNVLSDDKTIELTGYNSSYSDTVPTSITIPETIWYDGTTAYSSKPSDNENAKQYTVTAIASAASYSKGAFYNKALTEIIIPSTVTSIGDYAFYKCTKLTSVTLGSGVTSIGKNAFYQCSVLEKITIPESVTKIGASAFASCSKLKTLYLENLDAWYNVTIDASGAPLYQAGGDVYAQTPSGYTLLTSLEIPATVTEIGANLFYKWKGISEVKFLGDVTEIGANAFNGCSGLTEFTIPASVTKIGASAFTSCSNLKTLYLEDLDAWYKVTIDASGAPLSAAAGAVYVNGKELDSLSIPENVTAIGAYQFYNWAGITKVTFLGDVTEIGDYAFNGCSGLTEFTVPASVTEIGASAFASCSNLKTLKLENLNAWYGVEIGTNGNPLYAAGGSVYVKNGDDYELLTSLEMPASVESIGAYQFYKCTSLKSVTIGSGVKSIGGYAFYKCTMLTGIVIPDAVKTIGNSAFEGCTKLATLTIGTDVTSIGAKAFYGCTALTQLYYNATECDAQDSSSKPFYQAGYKASSLTVTIGANVKNIPAYLFDNNYGSNYINITSLVWEENSQCTVIGDYAFSYLTKVTSLTIPESVTSIGQYAFQESKLVTELYYNATDCTTVSTDAFKEIGNSGSGTTVIIGANVTALPANLFYTFYTANNITSVVFEGTSVTSIGANAFGSCTSSGTSSGTTKIVSVYYKGTESDWSTLTKSENFGSGNTPLTSATVYYYSEEQPATEGNYWHYDNDGNVVVWEAKDDEEEEA